MLNKKYKWALSNAARDAVIALEKAGVDPDLAFEIVLLHTPESEAWSLEYEESNDRTDPTAT